MWSLRRSRQPTEQYCKLPDVSTYHTVLLTLVAQLRNFPSTAPTASRAVIAEKLHRHVAKTLSSTSYALCAAA